MANLRLFTRSQNAAAVLLSAIAGRPLALPLFRLMSDANAAPNVRPASFGWRWRSICHALVPAAALRSLADEAKDGGRLLHPCVIVTFESPVATRMLAFLENAPADVAHNVEGILPISYLGRLNEAIVAAIVRAPCTSSGRDAALSVAAYVAKPYVRRSIQRLLSVDHVARSFHEMLLHPSILQILVSYKNFLKYRATDEEYTGPRIRCMTWPPEAQQSLVAELEAAGIPLGASVGVFTHLLCVVYVHDAASAASSNTAFRCSSCEFMFFGLLPLSYLPLGPSPDECTFDHAPLSASSDLAAFSSNGTETSQLMRASNPEGFSGSHSRAQYKLHEAIEALTDAAPSDFVAESVALAALRSTSSSGGQMKTDWCAIDVGAAPGGWTAFLAGPHVGCSKVMAVDAACLAPAVSLIPSVCHVRSSLQDALISGALNADAPYDLLVADLNADPRDCARWISALFPLMKPGSALILTMKLPYATVESEMTHGQPIIQAAADMLFFGWTSFHCMWLMANTVNERTLFAFRRAAPVGSPPSQDSARQEVFNIRRSHQFRKARALQRQATAKLKLHEVEASASKP